MSTLNETAINAKFTYVCLVAYRLQTRRLIHQHIVSRFYVLDEIPFEQMFFAVCSINSVSACLMPFFAVV